MFFLFAQTFPGMFLKPFKKLAASVLSAAPSGLNPDKSKNTAARVLNITKYRELACLMSYTHH